MSNLSNSSSQEQEEIKLEIVNNNNLEGKWKILKIKAGRDRVHLIRGIRTQTCPGVWWTPGNSDVFRQPISKISGGEASAVDKYPIRKTKR